MVPRTVTAAVLLLLGTVVHPLRELVAHPLHTTITDLTLDSRTHRLEAVIRVFADDFEAAVAGSLAPADARAKAAYLARRFVIRGADGKAIPLRWTATRRTDDLLWIHLEARAPRGLRGASVQSSIATELFADQVNIVKARYGGRERTLLFTRGTRPQRLP